MLCRHGAGVFHDLLEIGQAQHEIGPRISARSAAMVGSRGSKLDSHTTRDWPPFASTGSERCPRTGVSVSIHELDESVIVCVDRALGEAADQRTKETQ